MSLYRGLENERKDRIEKNTMEDHPENQHLLLVEALANTSPKKLYDRAKRAEDKAERMDAEVRWLLIAFEELLKEVDTEYTVHGVSNSLKNKFNKVQQAFDYVKRQRATIS